MSFMCAVRPSRRRNGITAQAEGYEGRRTRSRGSRLSLPYSLGVIQLRKEYAFVVLSRGVLKILPPASSRTSASVVSQNILCWYFFV